MTPAEEKNLHRRIDDLIIVIDKLGESIKEGRKETQDMIREVKHESKQELHVLKQDHCERLNAHSKTLSDHDKELSQIATNSKWISGITSLVITIAGFFFSRILK
jgi:Sec-independent protein translocase protein TatA